MRRLPLVHAVGATLVDDALGVAQNDVVRGEADRLEQLEAGDAGGAGAVAHELGRLDVAPGEVERIDQAGGRDDGGAVLVVMEHRNVEQLPQLLLDDEAFRRLDVLEVDAAPALAEQLDAIDDLVRVLGRHFEIDGVDVGEALEQHRLAFHHRLRRQRAAIAEPEDGGAVGDDGDEIALGGVVVGAVLVLGDGQHRDGDPGRIGQRQVALGRHRLGGHHLELAGTALAVEQQRFLVGERRPRPAAIAFRRHLNPLQAPNSGANSRTQVGRSSRAPKLALKSNGKLERPCRMTGWPNVADGTPAAQGIPMDTLKHAAQPPEPSGGDRRCRSTAKVVRTVNNLNRTSRQGNR